MPRVNGFAFMWTLLVLGFTLAIVYYPELALDGASSGLDAWWKIVLPSLLPFFIAAELLLNLGFAQFLGSLFEPLMRPLFRVPGEGGFAMALGFTCGAPMNAVVTASLRQQGVCTQGEAERLLCFTTNSSLLFMTTAIAVGMLARPEMGVVIAGSHILASITWGVILGVGRQDRLSLDDTHRDWSISAALGAMIRYQHTHQKPLGELLSDAVTASVHKILVIGGFIVLFSVVLSLLQASGLLALIASGLHLLVAPVNLAPELLEALSSGLIETTLGSKRIAETPASPLQQLVVIAMVLGWSGLSVQMQVAAMVAKTDIRMGLFVVSRLMHGLLAAVFTVLLHGLVASTDWIATPAFSSSGSNLSIANMTLFLFLSSIGVLVLLAGLAGLIRVLLRI